MVAIWDDGVEYFAGRPPQQLAVALGAVPIEGDLIIAHGHVSIAPLQSGQPSRGYPLLPLLGNTPFSRPNAVLS